MIDSRHDGRWMFVTEHFSVTYDGPAMEDHRIPVTELAPALLALSEMFMVAHQVVSDGVTPPPSLEVRANREGSFAVDLTLAVDQVVDLLNSREAVASATGATLLAPVITALRYWRHLRQGQVVEFESAVDPGMIRINWPDGTVYEGPATTQDLADSMDFRRSARAAMRPLELDSGIDTMEIRPMAADDGEPVLPPIVLDVDDARSAEVIPSDDVVLSDSQRVVGLSPLKASFESGYKWFVSDGQNRFWVTMNDIAFLQRVETSAEVFSAGDVLICRVRSRQLRDYEGELRMEHIVLEVQQHLRAGPPQPLQFDED